MFVQNILFDLDGTLVDSLRGIEYASRAAIRTVLPGRAISNLRDRLGPPIREIFTQIIGEAAPQVLDGLERQFRISYDSIGSRKTIAYDGVAKSLSQLAKLGILNFVVTNKPMIPTMKILNELGLRRYFQEIVSPDIRKPVLNSKVEMTNYLLAKHKLDQSATILVGDSEEDCIAARMCGLQFVAVTYGYGITCSHGLGRNIYIAEFGDLLRIVFDD